MGEHVSVHLRWSLLLDDHPDTPPATYEVSRGEGIVPAAFVGPHPLCTATINIPGRAPAVGYRSLQGIRQGDTRGWLERSVDALGVALHAAGYPSTVDDLKCLARWRQLKDIPQPEPSAPETTTVPPFADAELDTVMTSLGSRRPALEAWAKDQDIWPPNAHNVDRLLAKASELAADEVFLAADDRLAPDADPVAAAREFLVAVGATVPDPEPPTDAVHDIAAASAALEERLELADLSTAEITKVAQFLNDHDLPDPGSFDAMNRDELEMVSEWLSDEGFA